MMNIETTKQGLRDLAKTSDRPTAKVLRELLPEIEEALAAGVSRARIVEYLESKGLKVTVANLSVTLYRLRQERTKAAPPAAMPAAPAMRPAPTPASTASTSAPAGLNTPAPTPSTKPVAPEEKFEYGPHDPRRIDEILRNPPDMKYLQQLAKEKREKK